MTDGRPSAEANGQSEKNSQNSNTVCYWVYVASCLLCSFFGGIIGWVIRDMLIR